LGHRLHPDAEIEADEAKISGERKRTVLKRRSRRELEKNLTPAMRQAEEDIEAGWMRRLGRSGFGSNDLNRVRGTLHDIDLESEHPSVKALIKWLNTCPDHKANIVIDIAVFSKSVRDIAQSRAIHPETVTFRFYGGLTEYCKIMGWPSYTMAEHRRMIKKV
jgi:hypothetical protein